MTALPTEAFRVACFVFQVINNINEAFVPRSAYPSITIAVAPSQARLGEGYRRTVRLHHRVIQRDAQPRPRAKSQPPTHQPLGLRRHGELGAEVALAIRHLCRQEHSTQLSSPDADRRGGMCVRRQSASRVHQTRAQDRRGGMNVCAAIVAKILTASTRTPPTPGSAPPAARS